MSGCNLYYTAKLKGAFYMQKNIITLKDAAQEWVNEFNAIPYEVIAKICKHDKADDYFCRDCLKKQAY